MSEDLNITTESVLREFNKSMTDTLFKAYENVLIYGEAYMRLSYDVDNNKFVSECLPGGIGLPEGLVWKKQ